MKTMIRNLFFGLSLMGSAMSYAAAGGGGNSIGLNLGMMTASQDDLENHAASVSAISGRGAVKPSTGMEFAAYYEHRFASTMFAIQFRPSYFTQTGSGGTDKSSLTGYTLFPMLKLYPLENSFIKFFMQTGLGYGKLNGTLTQPGGTISFSGGAFGALAGLGASFCFTPSHCMVLEGNFRYLPIERNIVSSSYSTTSATTGLSQSGAGQELEYNGTDLKTTMSGILGSIGYEMTF